MNTDTVATPAAPLNRRHKPRSSLACLPCRSRHLKCDGVRPYCSRCTVAAQKCQYTQSRRGGLDRAALAERRKRLAATGSGATQAESADILSPLQQSSRAHRHQEHPPPRLPGDDVEPDITNDYGLSGESSNAGSPSSPRIDIGDDIEGDPLIASYYKNFHKFHPLVLPHKHLTRIHRTPSIKLNLRPLVAILRLIGHIYSSREWSTSLRDHVESCFAAASPADPIMVQCRTLYSIALFWNNYKDESKREMDAAVRLGLDLQMFRQDFAEKHGSQDAVLTECWRRTWWTLYMVDAFYAGTLGTMNFATVDVVATVDLPCEEWEYEQGQIPEPPKTLQDFDCRDLAPESTSFSSFAYLIGAVRCAALAISTAPKVATSECSQQILQAADAVINGWLLLLPKGDRKQVLSKTGELDELMFQAHLLIHVATVGLHRPLSDLKFNAIEWISTCARAPPRETPTTELINVHTVRVLKSTEAQIRLLALPTEKQFHHSPFTTCMVSEGTLALLSGCKFLFKGKELAIARDQIRMTIGCLKVLGELWPRTAKNVQEIQIIARHALGLVAGPRPQAAAMTTTTTTTTTKPDDSVLGNSQVPSLSSSSDQGGGQTTNEGSDVVDPLSSDFDIFASLGSMEDVCGWYNNSNDFGQDLSWWTDNNPL
ncbi:uncharacterized protein PV06_00500 [Exophiala oligosperma]|uniref:Zn(2)-C6 fungal-type domain-containing protein n=1 Tax=Exophiala oligosperma TaxID=215243 RepID=A0A0D2CD58_9EURO|nr:uncharacterized protein PV06_00500 [Exophiala oligosperma]KIW47842.1 hypothetical protein PV06_00500 [Exophiala oligosperma]